MTGITQPFFFNARTASAPVGGLFSSSALAVMLVAMAGGLATARADQPLRDERPVRIRFDPTASYLTSPESEEVPPSTEADSSAAAHRPASAKTKPGANQTVASIQDALATGQPRKALELLDAGAAYLLPAERHSLTGQAYLALQEWTDARRELSSAVHLHPDDAVDLYRLGIAFLNSGTPTLAAARFDEAHWHGLDTGDLHYQWARALHDAGQSLGDIKTRKIPSRQARRARVGAFAYGGVVLGPIPRRDGEIAICPPASAIYHVYRAIEIEPKDAPALALCARIWAESGRHERAVSLFERALPLLPADGRRECQSGWAESLLALGKVDEYLSHMRISLDSTDAAPSPAMAECYDKAASAVAIRGDVANQISYLRLAANLQPRPARHLALADALIQVNQYAEAIGELNAALEENPTGRQRAQIQQRLRRASYFAAPPP